MGDATPRHRAGDRVRFTCTVPGHESTAVWTTFRGTHYSVAEGDECRRCRAAREPLRLVKDK